MTRNKILAAAIAAFVAISSAAAPAMAHNHHHLLKDAAVGAVAGVAIGAITGH